MQMQNKSFYETVAIEEVKRSTEQTMQVIDRYRREVTEAIRATPVTNQTAMRIEQANVRFQKEAEKATQATVDAVKALIAAKLDPPSYRRHKTPPARPAPPPSPPPIHINNTR